MTGLGCLQIVLRGVNSLLSPIARESKQNVPKVVFRVKKSE